MLNATVGNRLIVGLNVDFPELSNSVDTSEPSK